MKKIDVIIPTLGAIKKTSHPYTCLENLRHIPWPINLHVINRGRTWAEAINIGLDQTSKENDVLIMDDDVFINDRTFSGFDSFYEKADIFGFKLLFPGGQIQHAGGIVRGKDIGHIGYGANDEGQFDKPMYVCHVTTSLAYIKRSVLDSLAGMAENIPGIQMEDVDFSFRALREGFSILYVPNPAIHLQSATKRLINNLDQRVMEAFEEIKKRHMGNVDFLKTLESYPKPFLELVNNG